ncbi:MAG: hypothetical protein MUD01_14310 [Chloroflexaceae bacterium]|jgi:alkylresorcinol/alkylpyrone synthase|nr:hypothetical protein [Chloroflexaceae bacterium]
MPVLRSFATALPPHMVTQAEARAFARQHFAPAFPEIDRYLTVFDHAEIDSRSLVVPPEWFLQPHSFGECNNTFIEWAVQLGETAARECLEQAGLTPQDVDHLIFVSTTGMAAPSVDAHLINRMAMNRHIRRTPVWGLGCAGGVAGLSRAYEYTTAFPDQRALLVSVELCSVTFQWNDDSKRNLIAASLFSDGAAAVLVEGDRVARQAPVDLAATTEAAGPVSIIGTQSTLWPDTMHMMGWDMVDTGMRVVFSSRIPALVQEVMRDTVSGFLATYGLTLDDMSAFVLHPGGAKVIKAYESALGVDPERLAPVREVLRRHGNMSAVTIFFVYEEFTRRAPLGPGEYGLLAVLGPGFSCELALVRG